MKIFQGFSSSGEMIFEQVPFITIDPNDPEKTYCKKCGCDYGCQCK